MIGYIYKTTNLINGKIYVGKRMLSKFSHYYKGSGILLKQAFKKYGRENFSCEMIDTAETVEELNEKESFWISELRCQDPEIGYNIVEGGLGTIGYHHTDEAKVKMREAKIGKVLTEEWKQNISKAQTGTHHTEETKEKIRQANLGHTVSKATREKLRQAGLGRIFSEETKQKLKNSRARVLADGTWAISEQGLQHLKESGSKPKPEDHRKHLSESRIASGVAKGKNNPRAKKVYCLETNTIYSWAGEAAEALNISVHMIRQCCQGKVETVRGYHLKWYILEKQFQ